MRCGAWVFDAKYTDATDAKFSIALYSVCMPMCLCAVEPGNHDGL